MNGVVLTDNILSENDKGILIGDGTHVHPGSFFVQNNEFTDNTSFGIENQHNVEDVNAVINWWGSPTGPYHPVTNPDALGDTVSDKVIYEPWLGPQCGDPGYESPPGDLTGPLGVPDCIVNMYDLALLTAHWLDCNDPRNPQCGM